MRVLGWESFARKAVRHVVCAIAFITLSCALSCAITRQAHASSLTYTWNNSAIGLSLGCDTPIDPGPIVCSGGNQIFGTFNQTPMNGCIDSLGHSCYSVNTSTNILSVSSPNIAIITKDKDFGNIFPLPKDGYLSIEANMTADCPDPDVTLCYTELTLINGEYDYRGIVMQHHKNITASGKIDFARYSVNTDTALISPATGNPASDTMGTTHKLRIDYFGESDTSANNARVIYYVDDVPYYIGVSGSYGCTTAYNKCGLEGSFNISQPVSASYYTFQENPRVALYMGGGDFTFGNVTVYKGLTTDQTQTSQTTTVPVTSADRVGQAIAMGGSNITAVKLYLDNSCSYLVQAFSNPAGTPGSLINQTSYQSDRAGLQDVPLWVPSYSLNVWVIVSVIGSGTCHVGTTNLGAQPYAPGYAAYQTSSDSGATWSSETRSMTFSTFVRN
jgi:hypothetical protein